MDAKAEAPVRRPALYKNPKLEYPKIGLSPMMLPRSLDSGGNVKEQYVGDINDYWKYCLLKALSQDGSIRIGVCWMLTPPDGRTDGGNIHYLQEPETYERFEPSLFRLLRGVIDESAKRRLALIEEGDIIPGAIYYNKQTPDGRVERQRWFEQAMRTLQPTDLVFFDPDNGLDIVSKPKGRVGSSKFIYRDEVVAAYAEQHSLLIYQHFPREDRSNFIRRIGNEIGFLTPSADIWIFKTRHAAFFMAGHPEHQSKLESIAHVINQKYAPYLTAERLSA